MRYKVVPGKNFKWSSKNFVGNLFRLYEVLFGRRYGVRFEVRYGFYVKNGETRQYVKFGTLKEWIRGECSYFEPRLAWAEGQIRKGLRAFFYPLNLSLEQKLAYQIGAVAHSSSTNGGGQDATTSRTFAATFASVTDGMAIGSAGLWKATGAGDVVTGYTYNADALTQVNTSKNALANRRVYLYYRVAPDSGTNDAVITTSESITINGGINLYSGVAQSAPAVSSTNEPSATATATIALVTDIDNSWVSMTCSTETDEPAAGTATTERYSDPGLFGYYDTNGAVTPAGSRTLEATATLTNWSMCAVQIAPPAVVGGNKNLTLLGVGT